MIQAPPATPDPRPPATAEPAVDLRRVSVRYGGATGLLAVDGVSLEVRRGEFLTLVGPSGCGKTSLLRVIGGLLTPTGGTVALFGEPVTQAQREKRIGLVFQEPALLPWRSVAQNVRLPLQINRRAGARRQRSVADLLHLVDLEAFRDYRPHQLSGGMQQRVALARALAFEPDILLMDEPLTALDEITREQMRYELLRIWETATVGGAGAAGGAAGGAGGAGGAGAADDRRKTVVFVTHSVAEAVILSDRVAVMSRRPGRIQAVLPIALPRPRSLADERSPAFLEYVDQIRALLREESRP